MNLFSTPKVAAPPPPPAVTPMPDPDAQAQAKKRALQAAAGNSGRASTFLSQGTPATDKMGG